MKLLTVHYCGWGEDWPLGRLADDGQSLLFEYSPEALSQGVELALVTSNTRDAARAVLGDAALRLFRHTHCGTAMFGKRFKLRELLWTSRLTPAEIVCIGDEIRDAEAARAVGLDFIGVAWGYTHPAALQTCCDRPLVETFVQLHDMLEI